jgi:hypothetical protein
MTFDYKKYSLENLENWMHDAMSCAEATPQEIYDVIKGVVEDNYYTYKHQASQAYELLALLNGNGKGHIEAYDAVMREKEYYEPSMPPWGHSDMEALQYTEEEMDAMCDAAKKQEDQRQMTYDEAIAAGWTMTADGFWIKESPKLKKDKVVKWQLPVEIDGPSGEYFICFPDDLLEAANLKEGDQVNWVDNGDGSYILTKVTEPLGMDEC